MMFELKFDPYSPGAAWHMCTRHGVVLAAAGTMEGYPYLAATCPASEEDECYLDWVTTNRDEFGWVIACVLEMHAKGTFSITLEAMHHIYKEHAPVPWWPGKSGRAFFVQRWGQFINNHFDDLLDCAFRGYLTRTNN